MAAERARPVARHDRAVPHDAVDWGALRLTLEGERVQLIRLPPTRMSEDVIARRSDLEGTGLPETMVVDTGLTPGSIRRRTRPRSACQGNGRRAGATAGPGL